MLGEAVILCSHLSRSCGSDSSTHGISSLADFRIIDFQFVQLFYCEDRNDDL